MKTNLTVTPKIKWLIDEFSKEQGEYHYTENGQTIKVIHTPLIYKIQSHTIDISNLLDFINIKIKPIVDTLKYNGNVSLEGNEVWDWNRFMSMVHPWVTKEVPFNQNATSDFQIMRSVGDLL
ncbi:hypothetical protein S140_8 [Shewanella sp. phage 1/40]|uniref:hypothetical protein n=1 Tax=Shewanella sp. phage 1/40 TaxID=1458860 RepID=UPI0004F6F5B5|nr:hypothetical protein S140_8 [Shewanella sp. phage 1/40]AHK11418.1 hypothetical protein S140_8 [Shewanella sp. phage 1/40]